MTFREEFWQSLTEIEISRDLSPAEVAHLLNQIEERLKPHLPNSVFKYRACNSRNFDALARNVIYAVPASYMNDPFDGLVYVDLDKIISEIKYGQSREFLEYVKEYGKLPEAMVRILTKESYEALLTVLKSLTDSEIDERERINQENFPDLIAGVNSLIDSLLENLQSTTLVSSFASDFRDTSMWAYYAENHTGFVVEYAVNGSRFDRCVTCHKYNKDCNENKVRAQLYPIVYLDNRYDATAHIDYTLGAYALKSSGMEANQYYPDMMFFDKCCLIKGKHWESENEWRLVCHQDPIIDEHAPAPIYVNAPIAIYYGARIVDENYRLLHSIIESLRLKGANIKEYKMYLDPYSRDFNLKYKEI